VWRVMSRNASCIAWTINRWQGYCSVAEMEEPSPKFAKCYVALQTFIQRVVSAYEKPFTKSILCCSTPKLATCDAREGQCVVEAHHHDSSSCSSPSSLATSVATTTLRPDVPMDIAGLALDPSPKCGSKLMGTIDCA
jgi:hypothetical protein